MASLIAIISPFLLNGIMQAFKYAAGSLSTTSKRVILAGLALVGALSYSELFGTPVDMDSISSIWGILLDSAVTFLLSHATYTLFFNKQKQ